MASLRLDKKEFGMFEAVSQVREHRPEFERDRLRTNREQYPQESDARHHRHATFATC
jgi:hypothetical protein